MHLLVYYNHHLVIQISPLPTPPRPCQHLLGQEFLERRLVNDNIAHSPEALAPSLLLLKQLAAARDVGGVQLGKHILAEGLDGLAGDDALAGGSLDDDFCRAK